MKVRMIQQKIICRLLRAYNLLTYRHFIKENNYAAIFNSATRNIPWLSNKVFYPSKSTANYSFLYIYLRALETAQPRKILEIGLGQSTILSSSYAENNPETRLVVLENNPQWIDIYESRYPSAGNVEIFCRPLKKYNLMNSGFGINHEYEWYDFEGNEKYDIVVLDAPCGTKKYARVGVLNLLPECLEKEFILIIDDYNVLPTRQTAILIEEKLKRSGVEYRKFIVEGTKQQLCLTSPSYEFMGSI